MTTEDASYRDAERRIEWRTPVIGAVAGVVVWFAMGRRPAEAVFAGTLLSWLNFRLLRQVVGTLANVATGGATSAANPVPRGSYLKIFGLLALLLLAAYVMLALFRLPVLPLLGGLLAVVPAILLELITELMRGGSAPAA